VTNDREFMECALSKQHAVHSTRLYVSGATQKEEYSVAYVYSKQHCGMLITDFFTNFEKRTKKGTEKNPLLIYVDQ